MSDSPRKTLGLPAKPGSETSQDAARKPVRGGAPKIRTIKKAAVEATASPKAAPAKVQTVQFFPNPKLKKPQD